MRRLAYVLLLSSTLTAVGLPVGTFAQQGATLVQAVLEGCPAGAFRSCVPAVQAAVAVFPAGAQRDAELIAASVSLAEIARRPQTPFFTCLDIADGIRVAGRAVTDAASSQALLELADSLCRRGFETAATGGGDNTPPASLVGGTSSDAVPPPTSGGGSRTSTRPSRP